MKKQTQKAGDESVNVQAESITINTGLSVSDAREIAIGVFRENFLELRDEAADVAFERARVFTDDLVEKLAAEPGLLDAARDPDYQYGLFTAQREYARTGDDDLGATLTDLLVRRAGHNERTLLQVALNEAIPTVGKLTSDQFSILSVLFLVRYTHWGAIVDFAALASMLDESIGPFIDDLPPTLASLQHLEYAGCGSIGIGEIRIEEAFSKAYPGTFSKGLTVEQKDEFIASQPDDSLPPDLFIPHHTEPELFRLSSPDQQSVGYAEEIGVLGPEQAKAVLEILEKQRLKGEAASVALAACSPLAERLISIWNESSLKNTTLTSVGIAIGHSNFRRATGKEPDLAIWLK